MATLSCVTLPNSTFVSVTPDKDHGHTDDNHCGAAPSCKASVGFEAKASDAQPGLGKRTSYTSLPGSGPF